MEERGALNAVERKGAEFHCFKNGWKSRKMEKMVGCLNSFAFELHRPSPQLHHPRLLSISVSFVHVPFVLSRKEKSQRGRPWDLLALAL